jgi:hypothetical protein
MTNISESFSVKNGSTLLAIEKKQSINSDDTIQFNMSFVKVRSYQFEVIADNLNTAGLTAFLEDSYTNTSTPIDLSGTTTYNFNIVNLPGSWNPTRFRIVFKQMNVLPVTFSTIKAVKQNADIEIDWKVENEMNIKQYEVEKSADGVHFEKFAVVISKGNRNTINYTWLDKSPVNGNNFYRIKSIGINGQEEYSSVVKVNIEGGKQEIVISPNSIMNNVINLQFNNMPAGTYKVRLVNNLGQVFMAKEILHTTGNSAEAIRAGKNLPKGIYNLSVIKPDNTMLSFKLIN